MYHCWDSFRRGHLFPKTESCLAVVTSCKDHCKDCKYAAVSRARCFHIEHCSTNRVFNQSGNSSNKKLTSSPRQCDLHCKTELLTLSGKFQQADFFLSGTCCACHPISKTIMKRCRNDWGDRLSFFNVIFYKEVHTEMIKHFPWYLLPNL